MGMKNSHLVFVFITKTMQRLLPFVDTLTLFGLLALLASSAAGHTGRVVSKGGAVSKKD